MTEAEWAWDNKPFLMVAHLRGAATVRKLRLYAHACVCRVMPLITDVRFRRAFAVLGRSADGLATCEEVAVITGETRNVVEGIGAYLASFACWVADDAADTQYYTGGVAACAVNDAVKGTPGRKGRIVRKVEERWQATLLRDIFGNPFRPVIFSPEWRTDTALALARQMYEAREFSAMPILADALQDAGCYNPDILDHCRGAGPHVRGCWVVDLVLGKE